MKHKMTMWLAVALMACVPAFAQDQTAKIHGHAQDPLSIPMKNAHVQLSSDQEGKQVKYTFPTDENGDYKGEGIAPGTYVVWLYSDQNKPVDQVQNVKFAAGAEITQDFDLTRPDYVSKLTPEQKKQIEEYRTKNAEISKENVQIKNLNAQLKQATADNASKNYAEADSLMTQATQAKPDAAVLWQVLGTAQNGEKKTDNAITSFKKALELDAASKKPDPKIQAAANEGLGEAYIAKGQFADATAAYDAAGKARPDDAARTYTNQAILMDRAGKVDETIAAAEKAIAADPNKPIPYYLKAKALVNKASIDPKTQKIVLPPGCAEAYQKYIELDPNGQFVAEAKQVLAESSEKMATSYKSGKK